MLAGLLAPVVGFAYALGAQALFADGVIIAVVGPMVGLAVATVTSTTASFALESRERRRIARDNEVLEEAVRERTAELHDTQLEIINRLGQAVDSRDEETGEHIARITTLSEELALAAGMSAADAERLGRASAMHDVGKVAIPDAILSKPAGSTPRSARSCRRTPAGRRDPRRVALAAHPAGRGDRPDAPRALGRRRLPRRPGRRGHPAQRPDRGGLRRLRRAGQPPPVQGGVDRRGGAHRDPRPGRQALRPAPAALFIELMLERTGVVLEDPAAEPDAVPPDHERHGALSALREDSTLVRRVVRAVKPGSGCADGRSMPALPSSLASRLRLVAPVLLCVVAGC
jgi:hypothetical protein